MGPVPSGALESLDSARLAINLSLEESDSVMGSDPNPQPQPGDSDPNNSQRQIGTTK